MSNGRKRPSLDKDSTCIDLTGDTDDEEDRINSDQTSSSSSSSSSSSESSSSESSSDSEDSSSHRNKRRRAGDLPILEVDGLELVENATQTREGLQQYGGDAGRDRKTARCRKCHYKYSQQRVGPESDYCVQCGRVASEATFDQVPQTRAHTLDPSCELLGTRKIGFKIKARDPRKMAEYARNWEHTSTRESKWRYEPSAMEHDAYRHKLGLRPSLGTIRKLLSEDRNDGSKDSLLVPVEREECILLGLDYFKYVEIEGSWDEVRRSGTFDVTLYLDPSLFAGSRVGYDLAAFLGAWYGVFPAKVSDLCWRMTLDESPLLPGGWLHQEHANLSAGEQSAWKDGLAEDVEIFKEIKERESQKVSLLCSNGSAQDGHLGPTANELGFSDVLKRYFFELLRHQPIKLSESDLVSVMQDGYCDRYNRAIGTVLGRKGVAFFHLFLGKRQQEETATSTTSEIDYIMTHLESVGYTSSDSIDGLVGKLFDFQSQTVGWAVDRERMVGGTQTTFWARLPDDNSRSKALFFNPILGRFRSEPPRIVRGGFMAASMGLGKTIMTLGLILKNPAPESPESGTLSCRLEKFPSSNAWNMVENPRATGNNGSVLSRGTLVICPVSLVGQWVDEAKSKLENPVGIYQYYGQNRERDPRLLATHSIVVTTYQVIASDAARQAQLSKDGSSSPLEKVRWWRIVCDEGHELRDPKTRKSKAVLKLFGAHKWLVSGTPMSTSYRDLTTQLKFLGIDHVERTIRHLGGNQKVLKWFPPRYPELQFLLGGLAMRHGQQQRYLGTGATLMELPKKRERTVRIEMASSEKQKYSELESEARKFYLNCRSRHGEKIGRHSVKLFQKLMPLRIACSGGVWPTLTSGDARNQQNQICQNSMPDTPTFTSKMNVLIAELTRIREDAPSHKSLVFSQFLSSLQMLQVELPKHGFQYRTLSGDMSMAKRAQALKDFHYDPPTTIFLLSMRSGAVGINLTEANRIFLLEPSLNPALETQVVGRVHRLGQKRNVEVVRLILKDSVESRMRKYLKKAVRKGSTENAGLSNPGSVDASPIWLDENSDCFEASIVGNLRSESCNTALLDFDLLFGNKSEDD